MDLGFKIQKTNLGIRIRILKIPSVPIFWQNGQIWLFWPTFDQKLIFSSKLKKANVEIRVTILEIPRMPTFRQKKQLWFFWSKFAQKGIWSWKFIKLMFEGEPASSRYHVCQFSVKTDNFDLFGPNLPKKEIRISISEN